MSDPNLPYGAVPPPQFPPPGGPGGPPYGGPPAGPPPFPPPGGSGSGEGKGLWIALAVVGAIALVGVIAALVVLLVRSGDDEGGDEGSGGQNTTAASDSSPEEVVTAVIDAAKEDDCDAAEAHLTDDAKASDPCSSEEFEFLATGTVDTQVGEASVDGEEATVPVTFSSPEGGEDYVFSLEQVDGTWLVASYEPGHGPHTGSTDSPTGPTLTDSPTDPSTNSPDSPGVPGGTSTADAVPNEPAAVVEAFLESALSGDCATAEDLVTEKYLKEEGDCERSDVPSDLGDEVEYDVGKAKVNTAAGTATVPVEITAFGDTQTTQVTLVKAGGRWLVDEVE